MKLGILKKDKTKILIESTYSIHIDDNRGSTLDISYITRYDEDVKEYIWQNLEIKKEDIQIIYFGGWND